MGEKRNCGKLVQNWDGKSSSVSTPNLTSAFGSSKILKERHLSRTCWRNCSDTSNIWATDNFRSGHYTVLQRSPHNRCLSDRKFYRYERVAFTSW